MTTRRLYCDYALLPGGWTRQVELVVDAAGNLAEVRQVARTAESQHIGRYVVPGMPNLHSHAFQRAMAGLAEHATEGQENFWTWRETMYRFAGSMDPDAQLAIAAQLYADLACQGYTSVCEFHYLHHRPDGSPYAPTTTMADALVQAASEAGIGLTLLPTLYMTGGFDGRALGERQRRFAHGVDDFLALIAALRAHANEQVTVGAALHSLRAVPAEALQKVLETELVRRGPVHIHIAEQMGEVEDCLKTQGQRPVAWLLDNADVDQRWCLVHATHITRQEIAALAASGAVAGICPTTEANLGDGLFPLRPYLDAGGVFGIGSDSHISVSPIEDLRWLEYGQRLTRLKRNVVARRDAPRSGDNLWNGALAGGAQASGRRIGALRRGNRADLLVLDDQAPEFVGRDVADVLDTLVFSGNRALVRDVMIGGRWVSRGGKHVDAERIAARYRSAVTRLMAAG
jgi:formimidoylglutamate deiminase